MAQDNTDCSPGAPETVFSLEGHERAIYREYLEEIVPLIASIEVYDNEFPAEILNEVRSIFTHFARCKVSSDADEIKSNMVKAERHLKRMRFDCCKYIAAMHSQKTGRFLSSYSPKALAGVNDGDFLIKVNKMMYEADEAVIEAKRLEALGDEDAALSEYGASADKYIALQKYIDKSAAALAHAQSLYGAFEESMEEGSKKSSKLGVAGIVFGAVFCVVGIIAGYLLGHM